MDGTSFDRLSVIVHRLRDQSTRRGALRLLLGGSVAAASGLVATETDAKKKNKRWKKCRGYGGRCNGNKNCCNGKCINGFCFPRRGGGGGGKNCGGQRCPNNYRCCRFNGINMCLPWNHPACFGAGECLAGWDPCGWNGPVRTCCSPDTHCCVNNFGQRICLSDFFDCNDFFSSEVQSAQSATDPNGNPAVTEPIPATDIDPGESS
jgi:hypothetical protein